MPTAYLTLATDSFVFLTIRDWPYNAQCVRDCFHRFLSREVDMMNPKILFAVGSTVKDWVSRLLGDRYLIQQLPHPAGRRRGFRDEHYKVLYFWLVLRALYKAEIVAMDEAQDLAKLYLANFEAPSNDTTRLTPQG